MMPQAFPTWLHPAVALGPSGYGLLFLGAVAEGPLVTVLAAFLASQGEFSVAGVYVAVVLGDLAGDALYYAMGRWCASGLGGRLGCVWRGRRGVRLRQRVLALREYLSAHPGRVLLLGKLTHSAGFAVLLAAGAARVRPGVYMTYNLLGTLPKSAALMLIGYFFGRFYTTLHAELRLAALAGLAAALLAVGVMWRRASRASFRAPGPAPGDAP